MIIYKTTNNINDKIYIGKDESDKKDYLGSGKLIKKAIEKYGKENFSKIIIDFADNRKDHCNKEKFWISFYRDLVGQNNMYNIADGGEGCSGKNHWAFGKTKENCERIQNASEKRSKTMSDGRMKGENNPFYKKHHSIETKEKISIALSNENHPMFGKHHSEETKKKMSNSSIAKIKSVEHKKKISSSMSKYFALEDNRKKLSLIMSDGRIKGDKHPRFGMKHSEETKKKLKDRWVERRSRIVREKLGETVR